MKKYKGTKVVSAEPMNEFDAVKKGIARPSTDNHEWRNADRDLINVRRDYALKTLKECDMALKELGDKDNLKE